MSFLPPTSLTSYIPTDIILPEDPEELRRVLDDILRKIIGATNDKDIGYYNTIRNVNGQKWFTANNPQVFKNVFRKVVDLGGLNDFTAINPQNTAHGIVVPAANFEITRLYGVATDPNTLYIPLPYIDMAGGGNHIQLSMDNTNIILTSNIDYSMFTAAYVVVEWVET